MSARPSFWTAFGRIGFEPAVLGTWRRILGEDFERVRPLLVLNGGRHAVRYLCPDCGRCLPLTRTESDDIAIEIDESGAGPCCENLRLSDADIQEWIVSASALAVALAGAMQADVALRGAPPPSLSALEPFATLADEGDRWPIYLLGTPDSRSSLAAAVHLAAHAPGPSVILSPTYSVEAATIFGRTKHALLVGEDHLPLIDSGTFKLVPEPALLLSRLKDLASSPPCNDDSRLGHVAAHLESQVRHLSALAPAIRAARENAAADLADARKTIEEMADGPERFLAGLRSRMSDADMQLFLLWAQRDPSKDPPSFLSLAELARKLRNVSRQAISARLARFKKRNPEAHAYGVSQRSQSSETVRFSEMSPSERDQEGIEKSYSHAVR